MSGASDDSLYGLKSIQEMLGVSRGVVMGYVRDGFVKPTRGPRNTYRFGFQDVVLLRTAEALRAGDIAPARIRRSLGRLRALLPPTAPLTGLRITAVGDDIAVRDAGQPVAIESGQLLFDFEVATGPGSVLSFPLSFPERHDTDDQADTWIGRGEASAAVDRDAALAAYRRALELDPTRAETYLRLGALLHEAHDLAAALATYDAGLERVPSDPELHYNRAIVLEDLGRIPAALSAYEDCIRLAPELADAHWNVARLYEQQGIAQQAFRHFSAYRRLTK